ncbi:hypothetical protein, partial [Thiocapsa sp.]|uniref:hypothetical protein n=1 Tax=Thiocapsa sp. TaxID=2024551 RepID=UPI0025FB30A0
MSLDLWFSIDPAIAFDRPLTLAAIGDDLGTLLSIHLMSDLRSIGVWDGSGSGIRTLKHPFE